MLQRKKKKGINNVYGKIAAVIIDKHRRSSSFRVGSMLFTRTPEDTTPISNSNSLVVEVPLARSHVAVPAGWVLGIEVDLYVEIPNDNNEKPKHLNVTLTSDKQTKETVDNPKGTGIEVKVITTWSPYENPSPQLSSPVQVTTDW